MSEKKNVMPEIGWSQLRHRWTPGFEDILEVGVNNGWYDPNNLLQAYVHHTYLKYIQSLTCASFKSRLPMGIYTLAADRA